MERTDLNTIQKIIDAHQIELKAREDKIYLDRMSIIRDPLKPLKWWKRLILRIKSWFEC